MEIKEMMSSDIEERLSQITAELTNPEADIEALTEEVRSLKERKAELKEEAEKRSALETMVNENEIVEEIITEKVEERKMESKEVRNSKEYINAFAEYIKTGEDAECRAMLTENSATGTVAVPELVYDVVKRAWDEDGIMKLVKKTYIKGNLKVGFEISASDATVHAEGEQVNEETLVTGIVNLVPSSIKKWISVSDEVLDMTGEAFLNYIYEELAHKIAQKASDELIAKIEACGTVSTTTSPAVPVLATTQITATLVAGAISKLSDMARNPVIIMNKSTYVKFKEVQYANNYGVDVFEGLPVLFNGTIPAFDVASSGDTFAIVGDLGEGAMANFPNGEEITFKFDDMTKADYDLVRVIGRQFVALGVVEPNAFVKVALPEAEAVG